MKINTIKQLIELVVQNNINELEVQSENDYIRISSDNQKKFNVVGSSKGHEASQKNKAEPKEEKNLSLLDEIREPIEPSTLILYVRSPIAGTVYLSSDPYKKNFVQVGQKISDGDTLCLIESMKTFTKITSYKQGVVTKCLVKNGQNIEAKQILFVIEKL